MCYILCKIDPMYLYTDMGEKGVWGGLSTPHPGGFGGFRGREPPKKKKLWHFFAFFLCFFWHMVFVDGFLIPVKELGLLTNLGQWIRGLDVTDPICILYCKQ
jgi:hypothetical protein